MADEVILDLSADGDSLLSVLDSIDAALQGVQDGIDALVSNSEQLSGLDDILAAITEQTDMLDAGFSGLVDAMSAVQGEVEGVASAMADLSATETEAADSADTAAASFDGLSSALGPLTMIATAVGMVGQSMISTGMQAQDSLSLAQRMAGATNQDIANLSDTALSLGVDMKSAGDGFYYVESAGYQGADAITVFTDATKAAKAGGTDALTVSNALTASLAAYQAGAKQAGAYTDMMVTAVVQGKQSFSDFASAIGPMASVAHSTGVSFAELTAAEATMTQVNPHVRQDATDISHLMQAMGENIDKVAATAKKYGLAFDEAAYKNMNFAQRLDYLREISYNNQTAFSALTGGVAGLSAATDILGARSGELTTLMGVLDGHMGSLAHTAEQLHIHFNEAHFKTLDLSGQMKYLQQITGGNKDELEKLLGGSKNYAAYLDILSGKSDTYANNLKKISGSQGATDKAFAASEQTLSAHIDHIGAAFSNLSTKLVDAISNNPQIMGFLDQLGKGVGQFTDFITKHTDQAMPILAGLAAVIGGVLVGAVVALVAAVGPVLAVLLALGAAVAGVVYAFQHQNEIMGQVNKAMQIPAIKEVMSIFQSIGSFLVSTFRPVWQQLVDTFNTQLKPAWNTLMSALKQGAPLFQAIGVGIGAVAALLGGILTGAIAGAIAMFASMLRGVILIVGGIVQVFSGLISFITGFFSLFYDILNGNWSRIGGDLKAMGKGIVQIVQGLLSIMMGIWTGTFGAMQAFIDGFVQGIIGFFQHLFDILVGHSIIPDLIDAILTSFTQLYDQGTQAVSNLITSIAGFFTGLGNDAKQWATDMITGFLSGLSNMAGQLEAGVKNVAGTIAKFLHFSKPEVGPLATIDTWMPDMGRMLADGLRNQVQTLKGASAEVAQSLAGAPALTGAGVGSVGVGGGTLSTALLAQIVGLLQGQQQAQQRSLGAAPVSAAVGAVTMNNTFNGVQGIADIYRQMDVLAGMAQEALDRGSAGRGL